MGLGDWRKKMMGEANRLMINQLGIPIAIDFGVSSLKLLQISSVESPALVAAACIPTPDELISDRPKRLAFQLEALPKLLQAAAFKGRRAVCAIPAGSAYCKHIQFQTEPDVTVAALVKSAVSAQLGCDPGALVFRHIEVGQVARGNKTEVICMAAARELVERLMKAMKEAKLEPVGMHLEYTATIRAFDSITRREEDAELTSLYLDIGAGSTKITIAHGRELVFARSLDLGGRHLDQAVAKQLKLVPPRRASTGSRCPT
jgi:Tfp pilus assembly PilM family ATPase